MAMPNALNPLQGEMAHLGKSVVIKGELSGSEDLYIDGQVEGSIELQGHRLTVGPNGRIKANVNASSAVIQGKLEGNIRATDRVDLKQTAVVMGDIATQRISIEDGAYFKGGVDIQKEAPRAETRVEAKAGGQGPRFEVKPEAKPAPVAATAGAFAGGKASNPTPAPEPRK